MVEWLRRLPVVLPVLVHAFKGPRIFGIVGDFSSMS